MTKEQASPQTVATVKAALESLTKKGFMEKLPDGTYKPTPLGRIVAKNTGGDS